MGFEQATIKIDREVEFQELKRSFGVVFSPENAGRFLKKVQAAGLRVRDLDLVLAKGILEDIDEEMAKSGKSAQGLHKALTVSDQAQLRELYLSRLEEVAPELRAKYQKIYRYY